MTAIKAAKVLKVSLIANRLMKALGMSFFILLLTGCGGSDESQERPCSRSVDACLIVEPIPDPIDIWWDAPITDFSENLNRPTISLLGDRTQLLTLGDDYLEEGALALDEQDGDISSEIKIDSQVNTNVVGDYLVRYSVTDSNGIVAIEQIRIVRIIDNVAENFSRRPLGSTISNFGYLEHLPVNYGQITEQKPPLLIYLHGGGGNLEFANSSDPTLSLDAVINNYGVPKLIEDGQWDDTLPFVVLAPHLGAVPSAGYKVRLDAFIEFAVRSYDVDISRVYLTGYSQGGFLSSAYTKDFPDKIAAIAPISPAFTDDFDPLPTNFCDIESVPVWFFHATDDDVIPFVNTIHAYNAILDNCQARVLPKLSLIRGGEHAIHHAVLDLNALVGGSANAIYDTRFDPYDISVYQWLLSHSLLDR
jgi:predicted esterase